MKKIKEFFFGKNDWKRVWWIKTKYVRIGYDNYFRRFAYCDIYFSPYRNRYKLTIDGYKPKKHSDYQKALDKLEHFNSQL